MYLKLFNIRKFLLNNGWEIDEITNKFVCYKPPINGLDITPCYRFQVPKYQSIKKYDILEFYNRMVYILSDIYELDIKDIEIALLR